jgi:hypothetical protein
MVERRGTEAFLWKKGGGGCVSAYDLDKGLLAVLLEARHFCFVVLRKSRLLIVGR